MAHYPADTFQEATEIAIEASNQLHGVINGDANAEVTVEDGSKIPSVRKAMVDSLYFKPPVAWAQGEYEDTYNQLREFVDGDVRTWWFAKGATVSTPVLMSTNPHTDQNWSLWDAITVKRYTCVADMVSDVSLSVGQIVETIGYYDDWVATSDKPEGGNRYEIVAAGTGTVDGGSFMSLSNGLRAKGLFPDGECRLSQFGAHGNGVDDDSVYIQNALAYSTSLEGEGLSYSVNLPIEIRKQIKLRNAKLYASSDINILHIDEDYQFSSELSLLENVTFGSLTAGTGVGIGSNDWVARWNLHNVTFNPNLRHAIKAPIILTNFTECNFTENGVSEVLIFNGLAAAPNRINNANTFNKCSFQSAQSTVSSAAYSIRIILGYSNLFSSCEFGLRGGAIAMMQLDSLNSIIFDESCWFEGTKSPYWFDCTASAGYKPLLVSILNSHLAVSSSTDAIVATLGNDGGSYNTFITLEGNLEESGTDHTWYITYDKTTLTYNNPKSLQSVDKNWLLAPQVIDSIYTLPAVYGAYRNSIVTQKALSLVTNTQYPTFTMTGNSSTWLLTGNTTVNTLTIRNNETTNLNFQFSNVSFNVGYDAVVTLGTSAKRWSTVYSSTSTISTSDEREKTFCAAELSDAVLDVWAGISWRCFKFNDAIADKGDKARVHFGLGAQSVRSAFEAAGLDPFKYALLCYDEWDETPEQKDEEGNTVVAYSPAGNRYGIRYEEALALEAALMRRTTKRLEDRLKSLSN